MENQQQSLSNKSPPQYKQERQCTHTRNIVALYVITVAVEKQEVLHILSVCL